MAGKKKVLAAAAAVAVLGAYGAGARKNFLEYLRMQSAQQSLAEAHFLREISHTSEISTREGVVESLRRLAQRKVAGVSVVESKLAIRAEIRQVQKDIAAIKERQSQESDRMAAEEDAVAELVEKARASIGKSWAESREPLTRNPEFQNLLRGQHGNEHALAPKILPRRVPYKTPRHKIPPIRMPPRD